MLSIPALIERLGGPSAVAARCGISAAAVGNWALRGAIAADHRITVWRLAVEAGIEWTPPGAEGLRLIAQPDEAA